MRGHELEERKIKNVETTGGAPWRVGGGRLASSYETGAASVGGFVPPSGHRLGGGQASSGR